MRIVIFAALVLLAIAGWVAGWYMAANWLQSHLAQQQQKFAAKGQYLNCIDQDIKGFPFRIGPYCRETRYTSAITGLKINAGELRSAAQIYQPGKAIIEIDGPAQVVLPSGNPLMVAWESFRSGIKASLSGPETLSVEGKTITVTQPGTREVVGRASNVQFHSRKFAENDVDVAVSFDDLNAAFTPDTWNSNIQLQMQDAYRGILTERSLLRFAIAKGVKGEIQDLTLESNAGSRIQIKGPFSVSRTGRLSGKFAVSMANLDSIANLANTIIPAAAPVISDILAGIKVLSGGNGSEFNVTLEASDGKLSFGFIPLGTIPPLF